MIKWLSSYATWSTAGWLAIIAAGGVYEGLGVANYSHAATFTSFVRANIPVVVRLGIWLFLGKHFLGLELW